MRVELLKVYGLLHLFFVDIVVQGGLLAELTMALPENDEAKRLRYLECVRNRMAALVVRHFGETSDLAKGNV
jgi:hypothetical protein